MMMLALTLALQPVTPVPVEKAAVLAPINEAFRALEKQDAVALLKVVDSNGRVTAVGTLPSGAGAVRSRSWTEYAARMKAGNEFIERIANPKVDVDGDIAMVWAPFTIEKGGKIVSCGIDHFDMVRDGGAWKIMNLTFSTRSTGCPGQ